MLATRRAGRQKRGLRTLYSIRALQLLQHCRTQRVSRVGPRFYVGTDTRYCQCTANEDGRVCSRLHWHSPSRLRSVTALRAHRQLGWTEPPSSAPMRSAVSTSPGRPRVLGCYTSFGRCAKPPHPGSCGRAGSSLCSATAPTACGSSKRL